MLDRAGKATATAKTSSLPAALPGARFFDVYLVGKTDIDSANTPVPLGMGSLLLTLPQAPELAGQFFFVQALAVRRLRPLEAHVTNVFMDLRTNQEGRASIMFQATRITATREVEMKAISGVLAVMVVLLAAPVTGSQPAGPSLPGATLGKLPIYFVENRGVYPEDVAYYVRGTDKTLYLTPGGITFRLRGRDRGWVLRLDFVGANPDVVPRGEDRQQAVFSYFKGPETAWRTGLPTFAKVVYENLWPGIDLVYRSTVNRLKYDFVVKPGADPERIRLQYRGASEVRTTDAGTLLVKTPVGGFEDSPPEAWQDVDGDRAPVEVEYALGGSGGLGFDLGTYDRTRPLVLDPAILVYCGYIGGGGDDLGYGITVDASGNAYVTGRTRSDEKTFPVRVGPDLTCGGSHDVFVAKVNAAGTKLMYCGYIGGAMSDIGWGIAVDGAGNAFVTGSTGSDETTFPVRVGPDLTYNGGTSDAFVAKVNASGTALVYCGYVGGSAIDTGVGIAVDVSGNAYVAGDTSSNEQTFPVIVGPNLIYNGGHDVFVAQVNSRGTTLTYCGYVGGGGGECCGDIAVDAAGNAYVTGMTSSTETTFPVKGGPDLTHNGGGDSFVAKVNARGTAFVYCGYVGGSGTECGNAIAVDAAGNAYVTGVTDSTEQSFPVKVGPDLTFNGIKFLWGDAFVAKLNVSGTALAYCGYIGGSGGDYGCEIAVDAAGSAYVTGVTDSTEQSFPVKGGPDLTHNGGKSYGDDAFVAKVSAQGIALLYCGYIGGSGGDCGCGIAVDAAGNAYVAGSTYSTETTFPVKGGPDPTFNGGCDIFVAKVGFTHLDAGGTPRPGGTIHLMLTSTDDTSLPYQVGTSLGTGPIPIDRRRLGLDPDALLWASVAGLWPSLFSGYRGVIDRQGQAAAAIRIPNVPALLGVRLHSAFVTVSPSAPSRVKSISNTISFSITK